MGGASNGTTTNGASARAVVVTPRSPADALDSWVTSEAKRSGKIERFELVARSDRYPDGRTIAEWTQADVGTGSPRDFVEDVLARAVNEQTNGFDKEAAFELVSRPSGRFVSLDVPVRPRPTAAGDIPAAWGILIDQLRRDQEHKEKFIAAAIAMHADVTELNVKAFKDREAQALGLLDSISKSYQGQVESLSKMVAKLMGERESMVEQYMKWSTENRVTEVAMKREETREKMKEEIFGAMLKPILPTIAKKLLSGMLDDKAEKKPEAEKTEKKPETKTEDAKAGVTEHQAAAVYALLAKLEEADYRAIAGVLSPEKQLLFVAVANAFLPGG
jgi:hypothetical protein